MQTMPAISWIQRFVGALPVPALALEVALMAMVLPVLLSFGRSFGAGGSLASVGHEPMGAGIRPDIRGLRMTDLALTPGRRDGPAKA
jgi:hypothetical protein